MRKSLVVAVVLAAAVVLLGIAPPAHAQEGPQGNSNCRDGVDNKPENGRIDFNDPLCVEKPGALYWPPITPDPCNDGVDNDGDGKTDYYGTVAGNHLDFDPDCRAEVSVPNDNTTYSWDPNASPRWKWCSDGVDNDGDGLVDGDDPNCKESGTTLCTNQLDDDYDGIWDFGPNYAVSGGKPVVAFPGWGDSSCHETLCQDGLDNDGDTKVDGADEDCQCLHDVAVEYLGLTGFNAGGCTANDTSFVLVGLGRQGDGCLNASDHITMYFEARLKTTASTRYDLGMWLSLDGTDAYNEAAPAKGLCGHMILRPGSGVDPGGDCTTSPNTTCSSIVDQWGILRTLGGISSHDGPYRQGETKLEEFDRCAEIEQEKYTAPEEDAVIDFVQNPPQDLVVYAGSYPGDTPEGTSLFPWDRNVRPQPQPYTFLCQDLIGVDSTTNIPNGFADIGTCASWDQQSNSLANEFSQAYPGTSAKCRCERTPTDIPIANVNFSCSNVTPPPGGTLDVGESLTNRVRLTNPMPAGTVCDPTVAGPLERYRCGTAGYIRIVVDYDSAHGTMTASENTYRTGTNITITNDTVNGRLIWTIQNRAPGGEFGVLWPDTSTSWPAIPALQYTYTLNSAPTADIEFPTRIYWSDTLNFDGVGGVSVADLETFDVRSKAQSCLACTCGGLIPSTNAVTLASFSAERAGAGVRFSWTTATEVSNVGFNIYGLAASGWQRLNHDLIPAQGHGVEPQSYGVTLDVPSDVTTFVIEDVDRNGKITRHREVKAVSGGTAPEVLTPVAAVPAGGVSGAS
jgi:hypothetical protein